LEDTEKRLLETEPTTPAGLIAFVELSADAISATAPKFGW
jgi:hypothetical protein